MYDEMRREAFIVVTNASSSGLLSVSVFRTMYSESAVKKSRFCIVVRRRGRSVGPESSDVRTEPIRGVHSAAVYGYFSNIEKSAEIDDFRFPQWDRSINFRWLHVHGFTLNRALCGVRRNMCHYRRTQ